MIVNILSFIIEVNIKLSSDSPIVGEGMIRAIMANNDERITKVECTVTCNAWRFGCRDADGKSLFPWKDCTFLHYEHNMLNYHSRY